MLSLTESFLLLIRSPVTIVIAMISSSIKSTPIESPIARAYELVGAVVMPMVMAVVMPMVVVTVMPMVVISRQ